MNQLPNCPDKWILFIVIYTPMFVALYFLIKGIVWLCQQVES